MSGTNGVHDGTLVPRRNKSITLRQAAELTPPTDGVGEFARALQLAAFNGITEQDMSDMMAAVMKRAKEGDPKAIKFVLDFVGGGVPPAPQVNVHLHWNGFRKRLGQAFRRQRGIPLFFFPGTAGLTLCSPRQTLTALAAHRMRKALRQAHFTRQAVASLDDAKLSVHERAHKARVLERTAHAARGMRAARKEFKAGGPDRTPLRPRLPV